MPGLTPDGFVNHSVTKIVVGVLIVFFLLLIAIFTGFTMTNTSGKSGYALPRNEHGGPHARQYGDPGDQPGYSLQKPYGTGVNALVCGVPGGTPAQNKAAMDKLTGAALEANIQAAMDDYLGVNDIALDKSLGSQYLPGPAGGAAGN
jgi:hypothetical protein